MLDNLFKEGDKVRLKNVIGMNIESDLVSEIIDSVGIITFADHSTAAHQTIYTVETTDLSGVPVEVFACAHNLERVQNPPYKFAGSIFSILKNTARRLGKFLKGYSDFNRSGGWEMNVFVLSP